MSQIVPYRTGLVKFIDRGTNINMILIRLNSQGRDQPSPTPKNKSLCRSICYCTGRFDMLLIGGNSHFTKYRVTESKICFKQNNWIINLIREQGDWFLICCWNRANRIKHYTRSARGCNNSKYFFYGLSGVTCPGCGSWWKFVLFCFMLTARPCYSPCKYLMIDKHWLDLSFNSFKIKWRSFFSKQINIKCKIWPTYSVTLDHVIF